MCLAEFRQTKFKIFKFLPVFSNQTVRYQTQEIWLKLEFFFEKIIFGLLRSQSFKIFCLNIYRSAVHSTLSKLRKQIGSAKIKMPKFQILCWEMTNQTDEVNKKI